MKKYEDYRVTWFMDTDVSEESSTRIFTVLDLTCRETQHAPPKAVIALSLRS